MDIVNRPLDVSTLAMAERVEESAWLLDRLADLWGVESKSVSATVHHVDDLTYAAAPGPVRALEHDHPSAGRTAFCVRRVVQVGNSIVAGIELMCSHPGDHPMHEAVAETSQGGAS